MKNFTKATLSTLIALSVTACLPESDDKESTEDKLQNQLPKVDQSTLDDSTPEGIWLVSAISTELQTEGSNKSTANTITKEYIVVTENSGDLSIESCSLPSHGSSTYKDDKFTASSQETYTDVEDNEKETESTSITINFKDNLSLTGTAYDEELVVNTTDNSTIETAKDTYTFTGIKISDETNISNASEFDVSFSISDGITTVTQDNLDITCATYSTFTYEGPHEGSNVTAKGSEVSIELSNDSEVEFGKYQIDSGSQKYSADIYFNNFPLTFECDEEDSAGEDVNLCDNSETTATISDSNNTFAATAKFVKTASATTLAKTLDATISIKLK